MVCVHEEDGGLFTSISTGATAQSVARRNRKLVVMFVATVANYTYGFAYKLGLDGTVEFEATLTGILSLGSLGNDERAAGRPYGQTLSSDGLYGPDHQHFFVARLDMAVDGLRNRVVEVEAAGAPDDGDHRGAFRRTREVLRTEKGAGGAGGPRRGATGWSSRTRRRPTASASGRRGSSSLAADRRCGRSPPPTPPSCAARRFWTATCG